MDVSRRAFFKTGIAGAVGITVFGFDAQPLLAQAGSLKISRPRRRAALARIAR